MSDTLSEAGNSGGPVDTPGGRDSRKGPTLTIKTPHDIRSRARTTVLFNAALGTTIVIVADIGNGKVPSGRRLLGAGIVYTILAFFADAAPTVAVPMAYLTTLGLALHEGALKTGVGQQALTALSKASTSTAGIGTVSVPLSVPNVSLAPTPATTPGANPGAGGGSPNATIDKAIKAAISQKGLPYRWGGEVPGHYFDCSGLTQWAYAQAGISIPRTTYEQVKVGTAVGSLAEVKAGDLVFPEPGHVGLAIGGGMIIEAPHTGDVVKLMTLSSFAPKPYAIRRIVAN